MSAFVVVLRLPAAWALEEVTDPCAPTRLESWVLRAAVCEPLVEPLVEP
jgi:hypothetical protein